MTAGGGKLAAERLRAFVVGVIEAAPAYEAPFYHVPLRIASGEAVSTYRSTNCGGLTINLERRFFSYVAHMQQAPYEITVMCAVTAQSAPPNAGLSSNSPCSFPQPSNP